MNLIGYIVGVLLYVLGAHADEPKGYKIILSSCESLNDANASLHALVGRFGDEEIELQKEEKYEMVARASGKTFIIAIEPLSSRKSAERVKKHFDKFYSKSYINGYFGPTEGAIIWKPNEASRENLEPSAKETEPSVLNNPSAVDNQNGISKSKSENSFSWSLSFIVGGTIIIILGLFYFRTRLLNNKKISNVNSDISTTVNDKSKEERTEAIQALAQLNVKSNTLSSSAEANDIPKQDIFFKLQKNIFFKTLLDELMKAARLKNEQRCKEIMEEIYKYQKNFRQSEKITLLQHYIELKDFDKLVELIEIQ